LVVSDGSDHLFFWDADFPFKEKRFVKVVMPVKTRGGSSGSGLDGAAEAGSPHSVVPLNYINELEVLDGGKFALANVWYSDTVVKIDLEAGLVVGAYDLASVHVKRGRGEDCLNGIALVAGQGGREGAGIEVLVTGKKWAKAYRLRLN
jgi:hypothetical protein